MFAEHARIVAKPLIAAGSFTSQVQEPHRPLFREELYYLDIVIVKVKTEPTCSTSTW
jgi:hypothetical protein